MMIPINILIQGNKRSITAPVPIKSSNGKFIGQLEHYLCDAKCYNSDKNIMMTDLKEVLTKQFNTMKTFASRQLSKKTAILNNSELEFLNSPHIHLQIKSWDDDENSSLLTKVGSSSNLENEKHSIKNLKLILFPNKRIFSSEKTIYKKNISSSLEESPSAFILVQFSSLLKEENLNKNKVHQSPSLLQIISIENNTYQLDNKKLSRNFIDFQEIIFNQIKNNEISTSKVTSMNNFSTSLMDGINIALRETDHNLIYQKTIQVLSEEPSVPLYHSLDSPGWRKKLCEYIILFSYRGISQAKLRLHPKELGEVKINLFLNKEQLKIHFVADNEHICEVIETSIAQLRASLADNGISLSDTIIEKNEFENEIPTELDSYQNHFKNKKKKSLFIINSKELVSFKKNYPNRIDIYV